MCESVRSELEFLKMSKKRFKEKILTKVSGGNYMLVNLVSEPKRRRGI